MDNLTKRIQTEFRILVNAQTTNEKMVELVKGYIYKN